MIREWNRTEKAEQQLSEVVTDGATTVTIAAQTNAALRAGVAALWQVLEDLDRQGTLAEYSGDDDFMAVAKRQARAALMGRRRERHDFTT